VQEAKAILPESVNGVFMLESSEQFDALVTVNPDKEVVLLAGLTWCRPCKSLTRPIEKMAVHYGGAVFAKVMGDLSDNTKIFFKRRLNVHSESSLTVHATFVEIWLSVCHPAADTVTMLARSGAVSVYLLDTLHLIAPVAYLEGALRKVTWQ
jgi:hypothetical protein